MDLMVIFTLIEPLLPPFAKAIEIAATQTKSAYADWVIRGVANPDLV